MCNIDNMYHACHTCNMTKNSDRLLKCREQNNTNIQYIKVYSSVNDWNVVSFFRIEDKDWILGDQRLETRDCELLVKLGNEICHRPQRARLDDVNCSPLLKFGYNASRSPHSQSNFRRLQRLDMDNAWRGHALHQRGLRCVHCDVELCCALDLHVEGLPLIVENP